MKNISLLLNIVLIIAVAYLYYIIYYNEAPAKVNSTNAENTSQNDIVFINSDSLLEEYNYFNSLKDALESKQDSIDGLLKSKGRALESEVTAYQERAAGMSPAQRSEIEEKLMGKQQQLMDMKQSFLQELSEDESIMNDSIHDNLSRFLKEYNKSRNFKFILGYQRGGGILLANDSLDITNEVLEGLNSKQ